MNLHYVHIFASVIGWNNVEWKRYINEWLMKRIYEWMMNEKDI